MMTTSSQHPIPSDRERLTGSQVAQAARLFDLGGGRKISETVLRTLLPDVETALFFAKAYKLPLSTLTDLLRTLFQSSVIEALLGEGHIHSSTLQDYIIDVVPDEVLAEHGAGHYDEDRPVPDTELLAQVWESAFVEVAASISAVADKIGSVLDRLPSKYGEMTFQHMRKMNTQRGTIGTYGAQIQHRRVAPRLVVFDVSGSVSPGTVQKVVAEVVGLAYKANASLAIVSDTARLYEMGTFDVETVLRDAEYGGTRYEQLTPIFDRDWETVVTIADYDSGWTAIDYIASHAKGHIEQVLDISLVNRVTYLAECLGRLASEVKPILVGNSHYILS